MIQMASEALDALHQLAASASEVHAAIQRPAKTPNGKLRVEMKTEEERTRKRQLRLLKNRQSAALSRQRKKEYINDLELRAGNLGTDKSDLEYKVNKLTTMTLEYKLQVDRLEKQLQEMTQENTELRQKVTAFEQQAQSYSSTASSSSSSSSSSVRLLYPPASSSSCSRPIPSVAVPAYPPPVSE